jgi:penicillin-binding protein 1A
MIFLKFFGWLFSLAAFAFVLVAGGVAVYVTALDKSLPDTAQLRDYQPPVVTRIHAADGQLAAEYAHERRLFMPIQMIPDLVKQAFISAEDKDFYTHPGIDVRSLAAAVVRNADTLISGSGKRMVGASTITQQVAKVFLLSNERTIDRKIKEALLTLKIEQAYSKDQILELYLNEIYLGFRSYGVAAASLAYFNKPLGDLTLEEASFLAALPKGPENYNPYRSYAAAVERRNYVIEQMVENGYATAEAGAAAKAKPLVVAERTQTTKVFASDYFVEEVRRTLLGMYGEKGLYEGGLSVRTTLDPTMQVFARSVLQKALVRYDEAHGWRGPVKTINLAQSADWGVDLAGIPPLWDVPEWRLAVVLSATDTAATIGLQPDKDPTGKVVAERSKATIPFADLAWARPNTDGRIGVKPRVVGDVLKAGDVVYVEKAGEDGTYRLRQFPKISGALMAMDSETGRVRAMVGGFSFAESEFNRATQAMRQPGSSFKPFVYSAALDNGYTPASVILDGPIEIDQGPGLGIWRPQNYGGGYGGPSTLRTGIERSRNLMTVRLAQDMGMPLVAEYAKRFGVYDNLQPVLSMALGAGETTVMRMVNAYSIIANGGRRVQPTLIDRVQDRFGRTIFKHDQRICAACNADDWKGQDEPELVDEREQVLDPMTAYQITSMMEGVVQRGTATVVKSLNRPIAGKTGTTNDEKDAWFVGFTPELTVGVFLGFDQPTPMGHGSTGGIMAAPVFRDFMALALAGQPPQEFKVPDGMMLIPIDRKTGMRSFGGDNTIIEAFKPGTGPSDVYSVIGGDAGYAYGAPTEVNSEADRAAVTGTGGLY